MSLSIRRVGPAEAEALSRLHHASFPDGWDAPSIARLVSGPGGFALIGAEDGIDCGFALLQSVPPEAELLSVGVVPRLRRTGIARALLRRAAEDLIRGGCETMFLDVAADNEGAMGLYRGLGFSDMSRRARYYRGSTDAIVMQAPLARIAA